MRKKTLTSVVAALSLGSLALVGCKSSGDQPADGDGGDAASQPADGEGGGGEEGSCSGGEEGSCGGN